MIRRTVARAFGPSSDEGSPAEGPATAAPETTRVAFVNRLFSELHATLERSVVAGAAEKASGEPALKVTKTRPRPEGLEFIVEGPSGVLRFLNTMAGYVWIHRAERGRFREDRLLTVHSDAGAPRLIERPAGLARAPFRFTSVPQIVRECLGGR